MSIASGLRKIQKGVEKCDAGGGVQCPGSRGDFRDYGLRGGGGGGGTGTTAISPAFPKLLAVSVETKSKLGWTLPTSPFASPYWILYGPARLHISKFLKPI